MNAPALPLMLKNNPSLDRWVSFPAPGKITVKTGRVEIGQGVLTAMAQIAADELDVAMTRIAIRSGDTDLTPNEGYTSGSHSIQTGSIALRQALADVRALFLDHAAKIIGCAPSELTIRDGSVLRNGAPTGQDYWTLAGAVDLAVNATGAGARKKVADFKTIGQSSGRLDLPGKIFGAPVFINDMVLDGMMHARVVRQPNYGASIGTVDEAAIGRAAKGAIKFVRNGNFLAIVGADETSVDLAGAAAVDRVTWDNVEPPTATQQEASWLPQRPGHRPPLRRAGVRRQPGQGAVRVDLYPAATWRTPRCRRPAASPCSATAASRSGPIARAFFPLRAALARTLGLETSAITVHHAQGAGCYGHNGATTPPPMPPSSPCKCRASRSGCAGGARKNSSTSRKVRP